MFAIVTIRVLLNISNKDTTVASTNTVVVREANIGPNPSTGIFNFAIKLK